MKLIYTKDNLLNPPFRLKLFLYYSFFFCFFELELLPGIEARRLNTWRIQTCSKRRIFLRKSLAQPLSKPLTLVSEGRGVGYFLLIRLIFTTTRLFSP
jgi:hypothetical protein